MEEGLRKINQNIIDKMDCYQFLFLRESNVIIALFRNLRRKHNDDLVNYLE